MEKKLFWCTIPSPCKLVIVAILSDTIQVDDSKLVFFCGRVGVWSCGPMGLWPVARKEPKKLIKVAARKKWWSRGSCPLQVDGSLCNSWLTRIDSLYIIPHLQSFVFLYFSRKSWSNTYSQVLIFSFFIFNFSVSLMLCVFFYFLFWFFFDFFWFFWFFFVLIFSFFHPTAFCRHRKTNSNPMWIYVKVNNMKRKTTKK